MIRWVLCLMLAGHLVAEEAMPDVLVESFSKINLNGKTLDYRIQAGSLVLKDKDNKPRAHIGYTAYFLEQDRSNGARPIAFCFNGGPGSASVWLNTGLMGPLRTAGDDLVFQDPPFSLIPNEASFLDEMDLVFVDPVSTGFSAPAAGVDVSPMLGVDEDVVLMADFVRLFTNKVRRFDSPKYFVSESYGAIRAAKVAYKLHDEYGYYLNALIFVSPALDLQTIMPEGLNDLPYLLSLPSFAAVNAYHKGAAEEVNQKIKEANQFALTSYAKALMKGDLIPLQEKKEVIGALSQLTGISESLITRLNMRIPVWRFTKNLLENEGKLIGRFDGRVVGLESDDLDYGTYDPSIDAIIGAVTATFNQYLAKDLNWPHSQDYRVLVPMSSWNWGKGNQYVSALRELKSLMYQNPNIQVVVASGLYDLATPVASVEYAINHMGLLLSEKQRIHHYFYPAGHMMYYSADIRKQMKRDIIKILYTR